MNPLGRFVFLSVVIALQMGCATTMAPTHPSAPLEQVRLAENPVRYDAKEIQFKEHLMHVVGGGRWKKTVAKYTAEQLNALVGVGLDAQAPATTLVVSFDLDGPELYQLGNDKEMSIGLTSTLPDGRVVRSKKTSGQLDDGFEYFTSQAFSYAGPVLDVATGVASMYFFFTASGAALFSNPLACGCLLGLAGTGIAFNAAQQGTNYYISTQEERRWSDLYQKALIAHVKEVRAVLLSPSNSSLKRSKDGNPKDGSAMNSGSKSTNKSAPTDAIAPSLSAPSSSQEPSAADPLAVSPPDDPLLPAPLSEAPDEEAPDAPAPNLLY